ncbi:MAG: glycosyl hydrolase [Thermoanaerobaculia bacterium]|nr:glycosyl hydrolase [Thermoanaerobaculia bacterium]
MRTTGLFLIALLAPAAAAEPARGPEHLKGLKYRNVGPSIGGRVCRAVGVPGDPLTYYAATASGGVWKSSDGGKRWAAVTDDLPTSTFGAVAVAPSDANVVYAGSGEANIRGNVEVGNGIYRSTDAGKTWSHVWKQEGQIGRIAIHPKNADVAFAAVLGHAFGPNPERGVYRTTDGGETWKQVLKRNVDTGASDVVIDPNNPRNLFAGLWQARRYPWGMTSGGPGSGLFRSTNGGDDWTELAGKGLPAKPWGKVGLAYAPSQPGRIYALIEADAGGLFRSDDHGDSWEHVSDDRRIRQRAWYYTTLAVSPSDADELWFPNVPLLHSIDGGKTIDFVDVSYHGDHHFAWIDPLNSKRLIVGCDGGVNLSEDGGKTWSAPRLPLGQLYHIAVDDRTPFHVHGAMQDIGTGQAPSRVLHDGGIRNGDWYGVGGGEAGWVVSHPKDPNIVYAGEYLGYLSRYDHTTGSVDVIGAWPDNGSGHGAVDLKYRFQWTAPIAVSPHEPDTVYHGANVLFRSQDRGQTWEAISPDLTRDDETKQQWSGGPITGDNTGVEFYGTIFVVAESPLRPGTIWAGTDDGRVHVTTDSGKNWSDVGKLITGLPEWGTVSMIEPSRFDAKTAYVVVDAHRLDDMRPYLFATEDLGKTWRRLDGDLPRDVYLHSVREDVLDKNLLYLGTERGVAISTDRGKSWRSLRLNLPTVAVHDLAVKPEALVVGTHGRAAWILDDLTAVRTFLTGKDRAKVALVATPPAVDWRYRSVSGADWSTDNAPAGATIYYWLEAEAKDEVTIEILDSAGRTVRRLSSAEPAVSGASEYVEDEKKALEKSRLAKSAGLHRALWDIRWDGAELIPGGIIDWGFPGVGPRAAPGSYTVKLTAGSTSVTSPLEIRPDPRSSLSLADRKAQETFALEVRETITGVTRAVARLRRVTRQLDERLALVGDDAAAAAFVTAARNLRAALGKVESELHNPEAKVAYDILAKRGARLYSRLSPLHDFAAGGDGPPPQGQQDLLKLLKAETAAQVAELDRLLGGDLAQVNQVAAQAGVPGVR